MPKYVFIASMDVDPAFEDLFNEVYDKEHVPYLLKVPGVRRVTRVKGIEGNLNIGGQSKPLAAPTPRYRAIYDIDSPEVINSTAWAEAIELGRWGTHVRQHTKNRHHAVYEVTGVQEQD